MDFQHHRLLMTVKEVLMKQIHQIAAWLVGDLQLWVEPHDFTSLPQPIVEFKIFVYERVDIEPPHGFELLPRPRAQIRRVRRAFRPSHAVARPARAQKRGGRHCHGPADKALSDRTLKAPNIGRARSDQGSDNPLDIALRQHGMGIATHDDLPGGYPQRAVEAGRRDLFGIGHGAHAWITPPKQICGRHGV